MWRVPFVPAEPAESAESRRGFRPCHPEPAEGEGPRQSIHEMREPFAEPGKSELPGSFADAQDDSTLFARTQDDKRRAGDNIEGALIGVRG